MLVLTIFSLLISSLFASTTRVRVDPINRDMFVTITGRYLNGGNPFEVRLDNQLFTLLNRNLINGAEDDELESIHFVSVDNSSFSVFGTVWRRLLNEAGFIGMGAGSNFVANHEPMDMLTLPDTMDRLLTLNARNFSNFENSCETNTIFDVPIVRTMQESALVNVRFGLQYPSLDGPMIYRPIGPELDCLVTLSGDSCAGIKYMTIPAQLGSEIVALLNQFGAVAARRGRNRFNNCDQDVIDRLPDLVITFLDHSSSSLGKIVQVPMDYIILNTDNRSCELRFDVNNDSRRYAMDPMALAGVNIRLERTRISFGEPRIA